MISIQIFALYIHITSGFETEERSLEGDTDLYIIDANLRRPLDT